MKKLNPLLGKSPKDKQAKMSRKWSASGINVKRDGLQAGILPWGHKHGQGTYLGKAFNSILINELIQSTVAQFFNSLCLSSQFPPLVA